MSNFPKEKQVLELARHLIGHSDNWTQFTMARDVRHYTVSPLHETACHYCATGAIERACWELEGRPEPEIFESKLPKAYERAITLLGAVIREHTGQFKKAEPREVIAWMNDSIKTSHKAMLNYFDMAIAKFEHE